MGRVYIKCPCYCPHCKRRHEGVVPRDVVAERARASQLVPADKLFYCAGEWAEYKLATRYLPRVECDACTINRVGPESAARIKACENMALENSAGYKPDIKEIGE